MPILNKAESELVNSYQKVARSIQNYTQGI